MTLLEMQYRPDLVSITWDDESRSDFDSLWLYDNSPEHRDSSTGQRLLDIADLPPDPLIDRAIYTGSALQVAWEDTHTAQFKIDWLHANRPLDTIQPASAPSWWRADCAPLRRFDFREICLSEASRLEWLRTLADCGLAILSGVPPQDGQVLEVAALIGWVRETNYGRVFDVQAVPDPNNLAYTGLALGLHTDNPYRDPVPGLQLLHCLTDDDDGGTSLFVDGFAVAEELSALDPDAFEILASTPVRFEFRDAQCYLSAWRPIVELDLNGEFAAIHYNNRALSPLRLEGEQLREFYPAYRHFALLLKEERFIARTRLRPGELAAFDNRRVLHGRTGFSSAARHLQGCYLDRDGLLSNIAVLERRVEHSYGLR